MYVKEGLPFVLIGTLMYIIIIFIRDTNIQPLIRVLLEIVVGGGIYLLFWGAYEIILSRRRKA